MAVAALNSQEHGFGILEIVSCRGRALCMFVVGLLLAATPAFPQQTHEVGDDGIRILAGPMPQNVTDHSATIFWLSTRNGDEKLRFGASERALDQVATEQPRGSGEAGNQHRASLTGLRPDQTYFFEILSESGARLQSGQFQTEPEGFSSGRLAIVDGPVFEYLDAHTVEIAWTTSAPSSTLVRYGTDPNSLRKVAQAPWGEQTHRVEIKGLDPDQTYYFVVESAQAKDSGTMAKSAEGSFHTEAEGQAALRNIEPRR